MAKNKNANVNERKIKVLVVTPEITYIPAGMGNISTHLSAKAGGMADVSATLVKALYDLGADVHVAIPHYRQMYKTDYTDREEANQRMLREVIQGGEADHVKRVHLASSRLFNTSNRVYGCTTDECLQRSLAFQREVINTIIPEVNPDLIHCNDWMTGLIPSFARILGIRSLFTVHNIHTVETTLERIEDYEIDTEPFWCNLYFTRQPYGYAESRRNNRVDLLASGIFGAHFINTVSPTFLQEIVQGYHDFIPYHVREEIKNKYYHHCAEGILNAPDPEFNTTNDPALKAVYSPENHFEKKKINKLEFQKALGLKENADAPLFYWPSRLDPIQKGPQLLTEILYQIIHDYWERDLQVAIVADGSFQTYFYDIIRMHGFDDRVAVHPFNEKLAHLGYAASDFVLMPSKFEPCGLPQMIGPIYGSLPVVHDTGGIHDTVQHIDLTKGTGNGFMFKFYDAPGLRWAIDEAMRFNALPVNVRCEQIARIMKEAKVQFTHNVTAQAYIHLYEQMMDRQLVPKFHDK
ncbi:MAG: glycogen/starch synthase [Lentisphaeria bacterium]|nr:glycogen/starch synthase [Lentisphaeria bacterium]